MGVCCGEPEINDIPDGNIKFKTVESIDQEEDKKRHNAKGSKMRSILKKPEQPLVKWEDVEKKIQMKVKKIEMPENYSGRFFVVKFREVEKKQQEMFKFDDLTGEWQLSKVIYPFGVTGEDNLIDISTHIGVSEHSKENRKKECRFYIAD